MGPGEKALASIVLAAAIITLLLADVISAFIGSIITPLGRHPTEVYGLVSVEYSREGSSRLIVETPFISNVACTATIYAIAPRASPYVEVGVFASQSNVVTIEEEALEKLRSIGLKWVKQLGSLDYVRISALAIIDVIDKDTGYIYTYPAMVPLDYSRIVVGEKPIIRVTVASRNLRPIGKIGLGRQLRIEAIKLENPQPGAGPAKAVCVTTQSNRYCYTWAIEKTYYTAYAYTPLISIYIGKNTGFLENKLYLFFHIINPLRVWANSIGLEVTATIRTPDDTIKTSNTLIIFNKREFGICCSYTYYNNVFSHGYSGSIIISAGTYANISLTIFRKYKVLYPNINTSFSPNNLAYKLSPTNATINTTIMNPIPYKGLNAIVFETEVMVDERPDDGEGYLERYYRYMMPELKEYKHIDYYNKQVITDNIYTLQKDEKTVALGVGALTILTITGTLPEKLYKELQPLDVVSIVYRSPGNTEIILVTKREYARSIYYITTYQTKYTHEIHGIKTRIPIALLNITNAIIRFRRGCKPLNSWKPDGTGGWPPDLFFTNMHYNFVSYKVKAYVDIRYGTRYSMIPYGYAGYIARILVPGVLKLRFNISYKIAYSIRGYARIAIIFYVKIYNSRNGRLIYASPRYTIFSYDTGPPTGNISALQAIKDVATGSQTIALTIPFDYTDEYVYPANYKVYLCIKPRIKPYTRGSTAVVDAFSSGYFIKVVIEKNYTPAIYGNQRSLFLQHINYI